jgi:hypothetical protein
VPFDGLAFDENLAVEGLVKLLGIFDEMIGEEVLVKLLEIFEGLFDETSSNLDGFVFELPGKEDSNILSSFRAFGLFSALKFGLSLLS